MEMALEGGESVVLDAGVEEGGGGEAKPLGEGRI